MQKLSDEELAVWDRYAAAGLILIGELQMSSAAKQSGLLPASVGSDYDPDDLAASAASLADALLEQRRSRSSNPG